MLKQYHLLTRKQDPYNMILAKISKLESSY